MLFPGIDLHNRTIAIQTVDGEGTVVRQAQLVAQRPALTAYSATRYPRSRCEWTGVVNSAEC